MSNVIIVIAVVIPVAIFGIEAYDLMRTTNTYVKVLLEEKEAQKQPQCTTRQ